MHAGKQLPHALILHGARGIGKGALAAHIAQFLLCSAPTESGGCGTCAGCIWLAAGTHPDFSFLRLQDERDTDKADAAGSKKPKKKIPIEAVRAVLETLALTAHRVRRVILIEPAEALTRDAANALLKTLEEPPAEVVFILVSHRPGLLLATLRSRCRLIAVPSPSAHQARTWLAQHKVTDALARLSRNAGAPLLALAEMTDTLEPLRIELIENLARGARFGPIALAERIAKAPPAEVLRWLQYWTHDLMTQKIAGMCRYNSDRAAQLAALAKQIPIEALLNFQRGITEAAWLVEHPLNTQLYFEQQLIAYAELFEKQSTYV